MLPILVIGPFSVGTYPLVYAVAVISGGILYFLRAPLLAVDKHIQQVGQTLVLVAIVAGLFIPSALESGLRTLLSGEPPAPVVMRVYYGLGCGVLAGWLFMRRHGLPILPGTDRAMAAFALAFSIARWGCLAAGCCGGIETDGPLGILLPDSHGHWARRYPTQLLSCGFEFILFAALLGWEAWLKPRRQRPDLPAWVRAPGLATFGYLFFFSLERFTLEFVREDFVPLLGPFSLPHLLMLGSMALALGWIAWRVRHARQSDLVTL